MSAPRLLSKSQYTRGMQCPKSLWLYRHRPELREQPDAHAQMIFDQGTEIGTLARQLYPGGVLIAEDHTQPEAAVAATQKAVQDGARVLYEAAAVHSGVLVRADILTRREDDTWAMVEVKSSTSVKDVHLHDLAVQKFVLDGAGFKIAQAVLLHVNKDYVRDFGEINLGGLFTAADQTIAVAQMAPAINIMALAEMAAKEEPPPVEIGAHCDDPYPCDFKANCCWKDVPEGSIWDIGGLRKKRAEELWRSGVRLIEEISDRERLNAKQAAQVRATKTGAPCVDKRAVAEHLASLRYPLAFLDFEAVNPALPPYRGLRPYQNLAFEASVHLQHQPGGALEHAEILVAPDQDPRRLMAEFLRDHIPSSGSVIAFNASYESGCMGMLADAAPQEAGVLDDMRRRLWDLAVPFRSGAYMHPGFHGSWSIKQVLPVLVPGMGYQDLEVGAGGDAAAVYWAAMTDRLTGAAREQAFNSLRAYCALDTMAMVRVLEKLRELVTSKEPVR